jgi:hypothetical protein
MKQSRILPLWTAALLCGLMVRAAAGGFVTLVGDLPRTISAEKGPYLVTSDVFVPAGRTVSVEAGTVFLFRNFTGLHVQGTLIAKGTAARPVVFSSENDKRFNPGAGLLPNPYDWNGIFVHDDAIGTDLQHVEVAYSVYGINSLTKFIRILDGVFRENGRASLTIEGQAQNVGADPFSYSLSVKNASVDGVPVKILKDPDAPKRNAVRYTGLSLLVVGVVVGAVFTEQWNASKRRMSQVTGDLYTYEDADFLAAQKTRNNNATIMSAGYCIGLVGACGFTYSFFF